MKVIVYDDKWSILHTFFGFIAGLLGLGWIAFIAYTIYEFIEYMWRSDYFKGDMIEFMVGLAASELAKEIAFVLSSL